MANDLTMQVVIEAAEEPRTGMSNNGPWMVQNFVAKTIGYNPRQVCFEVMGEDKISRMNIKVGSTYTIYLDVFSRQYVGKDGVNRWTNVIRCYDARPIEQ